MMTGKAATYLESHTGNITLSLSLTTKSGDENLVVLVDEIETTVVWHECSNLLSVLDQLYSHSLSDGRVGLLGFYSNLLEHDSLGVRGVTERVGSESCS